MAAFKDKLYIGLSTTDAIQRFNGEDYVEIRANDSALQGYDASFVDGNNLFIGGIGTVDTAFLFLLNPECSDEILISDASPFGWNRGSCEILPDICDVENGNFCETVQTGDIVPIQIQYNGSGTPALVIEQDGSAIVDSSNNIITTDFQNIISNTPATKFQVTP